jgi:hypothetical protein
MEGTAGRDEDKKETVRLMAIERIEMRESLRTFVEGEVNKRRIQPTPEGLHLKSHGRVKSFYPKQLNPGLQISVRNLKFRRHQRAMGMGSQVVGVLLSLLTHTKSPWWRPYYILNRNI